tara:strand:+ start:2829 stop:3632 length:804 start_codon:yes stop_codon:yes gene_type:complete
MNKKVFSKYFSLDNLYGTQFNLMTNYQMYEFTKDFIRNKRVLDIGCSVGRGLGFLSEYSDEVVGLDVNEDAIKIARNQNRTIPNVKVIHGDIENLSFDIGKFDTVLIFQTLYLINVNILIDKLKDILNTDGRVVIMSINPDRADFNPSMYSIKYHKIGELLNIFEKSGFSCSVYGSIHDEEINYRGKMNKFIKIIKLIASKIGIVPNSYRFKKILKRVFYGSLKEIPNDIREVKGIKYITPARLENKNQYKDYICFYLLAELKSLSN